MALLGALSLSEIVTRIAAVLLFASLQGCILAGLARLMGDARPFHEKRLTLNPFVQVSVWGIISATLFALSWVRPIRYEPKDMRLGGSGLLAVLVVGLALMLALVPLSDFVRPLLLMLPRTAGYAALYVLNQFQLITVGSVVLNCLPVPGLVAGALWQLALPEHERRLERLVPIGLGLVFAAIVAGIIPNTASAILPYLRA
ncbi:hypothetical protein [Paradevosia shaoguanensis]|uniref:Peptidase M50 domain-containing protein n=1 Tax=Paradevosia shaoguanensis TaxID=1335043 RepID=A0AA41QLC7_9HYPH|nr:hypothetical protein [Paradevosia shaoguanensis]MCF1742508.1 hypothetical protein [Paradevosia shaoguanensis]MCI0126991.1 hypothetical protein [Paradevosia shaoguanensis]